MEFSKLNNLLGWLAFGIAMFVYGSTVEPTASFWDCGEYIATSNKLEVGHPPGAPLFMMIGRVVSMFAPSEFVALMINMLSALSSALTILFLFWTISMLGRKIVDASGAKGEFDISNQIAVLGSAMIGALIYTFSDTFWFSAVEGEVYAMSSLFTAIVFWAILKWERVADEPGADRWLVLIAYLVGLSIGVHLLNLLAIPAMAFVYYYKKYPKITIPGIAITGVLSIIVLGVVQNVIIPGAIRVAYNFELFFVNGVNMPLNSGSYIFIVMLSGALAAGIYFTHKRAMRVGNVILVSLAVLLIGYSSFAMILVRSSANPPIDENNPENMINLLAYLNRDQYGEWPLLHGQYFNSPLESKDIDGDGKPDPYVDNSPLYYQDKEAGRYIIQDKREKSIPNYHSDFEGIFPRMWSSKGNHVKQYKRWSGFKGRRKSFIDVSTGERSTVNMPTMGENITFFVKYQIDWMYVRYFMWNFAGRQNDIQGHGDFRNGNWISGINFIDENFRGLGPQDSLPDEMANNKARNKFYFLPLILGLLGMFFQFSKDWKSASTVMLLFFFTGLAIVVYLNQYPLQPRERDYAYAGSFYAFAIWCGFGVMGILNFFNKRSKEIALAVSGVCLFVPSLMAYEGWDDHDRSGRYTARDIARDYLDSCAPNAILFTNGDNDTFPLWYIQEVEQYRTDVRVVNLTLLSTDWFINQMKRKAYYGLPIPSNIPEEKYRQGTRDYLPVMKAKKNSGYVDIRELMPFVTNEETKQNLGGPKPLNYFPTNKFRLPVDSAKVVSNGTVPLDLAHRVTKSIDWKVDARFIMKSEMIVLDILANNNWERPIYFANTMPRNSYFGLENYLQHEGFAYRLVPIEYGNTNNGFGYLGDVNTDIMYENLMTKFRFGGLENEDLYLDENNLRFVTNLRLNFIRLASKLFEEGQTDKAKNVLDKALEVVANDNTPTDVTLLQIAELLYRVGETEKANALTMRLAKVYEQNFYYYMGLDRDEQLRVVQRDIQQAAGVFQRLQQLVTKDFAQSQEMQDDFNTRWSGIESALSQMMQQQQQQFGPSQQQR